MDSSDDSSASGRGRRSKVSSLIEEYNLQGLGAELERSWTAEDNRKSLRELADYFNTKLLEEALNETSVQHLDGEIENIYRLLSADDVSSADRTRTRRRLEREGIDVESLQNDFVTYQAIRSYLKEYRGAEYTPAETDPIEREASNIQQMSGWVASVTEGKLDQLRKQDDFTLGEFRTLSDILVVCEDCNSRFNALELLDRGGCNCPE